MLDDRALREDSGIFHVSNGVRVRELLKADGIYMATREVMLFVVGLGAQGGEKSIGEGHA